MWKMKIINWFKSLNLPNQLTVIRVLLIPFFLFFLYISGGILFNTEEELKNAIISLLNNNALYEEISQKCRDRAERYDIKRMAEDLIKLYSGGSNS
jgi:glycosyltransferase involved in cell wall biosynthesis